MVPKMSSKQLANLEQHIKADLKNISGIAGFYHSLTTMPKDVQTKLLREELLFDDNKGHTMFSHMTSPNLCANAI